ncbi:MAG: hypothetical protein ACRD1K_00295 [Acidimicrobiales bacterium]
MIGFFVILAILMVLVFAAGDWLSGSRTGVGRGRRVVHERGPTVERAPRRSLGEEIVEEEWTGGGGGAGGPTRSRRVVRRRQF